MAVDVGRGTPALHLAYPVDELGALVRPRAGLHGQRAEVAQQVAPALIGEGPVIGRVRTGGPGPEERTCYQQQPALLEYAMHLDDGVERIGAVLEDLGTHDRVELLVLERQVGRVTTPVPLVAR